MTKELSLWRTVREGMHGRWHATRHEGPEPGTPDVSYAIRGYQGWMELKSVARPKLDTSVVRVKHFTEVQQRWMKQRAYHAGHYTCWVLLKVGTTYMLIEQGDVSQINHTTFDELMDLSEQWWERTIDFTQLVGVLTRS